MIEDVNEFKLLVAVSIAFNLPPWFATDPDTVPNDELKLPVEFYKNIFEKTKDFHSKNFKLKCSFIAIDGVYCNTNVLHNGEIETSMSLGFFDINNSSPVDLHFTGIGKKNNECLSLEKYIGENLDKFKNKIIICDRAYFCYRFFNFLERNNIKFIIYFFIFI